MTRARLRFCFLLEEEYRQSRMPMAVVRELTGLGHEVMVHEPRRAVVNLTELIGGRRIDATVLRTVSGGPGVSLLQAVAAAGVPTINDAAAVRRVRDKAVVAATAHAHRIPFPETEFVADRELLEQLPEGRFPLVVKPSVGGFGRAVRLIQERRQLASLDLDGLAGQPLVAQSLVAGDGYDVKLYNTGQAVHAVRRRSSLHGGQDGEREWMAVDDDLRGLAQRIGMAYQLDIYGADVVEGPDGRTVVDVNDFPSFGTIDSAPQEVAASIVEIARRGDSEGRPG